jgi:hypothetical protein
MIFLYYAYVGICSLKDGFDLNKSTQSVAIAPATATWTFCHISVAASNWFDNVYLNPICLDLYKHPKFTKSGLVTRPFDPTTLFVNFSAPPASSNLPFGSDARKHPSNHISIFYAPCLKPSTPSLCPCYPISACLPPTIVLIPSLPPVHPSHPHNKTRIRTSTHQKLFGPDTSFLQATHIYSTITLIFLPPLQVFDKFESRKPSTSCYLHHHHHQIHHNFQFPPATH